MNQETRNRALVLLLLVGISFMLACGQTPTTGGGNSGVVAAAPAGDVLGGSCTTAYTTSSTNSDLVCSVDCGMTWRSLSNPGVCYNNQTSGGGSSNPPAPVADAGSESRSASPKPTATPKSILAQSSSVVDRLISTAKGEVGICGDKARSRYGSDIDGDWCATFVTWVSRQAGANFSRSKKANPSPGDKVLFDFGDYGHVGFVIGSSQNTFATVEGNVNDCVVSNEYSIGATEVVGFYSPQ